MHIQPCNIQNSGTSRTQDDQAYLEPCHSQNIMQAFSEIFRDIQRYWCILIHTLGCAIMPSQPLFENRKKCFDLGKKRPWLCPSLEYISHSKYSCVVVQFFTRLFRQNVYWSALVSSSFPCPVNFWLRECILVLLFLQNVPS